MRPTVRPAARPAGVTMPVGQPNRAYASPLGAFLMAMWGVAVAGCLVASMVTPDANLPLYGSLACMIVTAPMLSRRFEWVSPWSLVALAIYLGSGARSFMIWNMGLDDPVVNQLYLRGRGISEYPRPVAWYLLGLALLTAGYTIRPRTRKLPASRSARAGGRVGRGQWLRTYTFGPRVWPVVLLCAAIGLFAFLRYASATGGLDLTNISAKRTAYYVEGGQYQGGHGVWRVLNELSSIAFWVAIAKISSEAQKPTPAKVVLLLVLFANAVLLPFYSSVRSQVVYIVLTALVLLVCVRGRVRMRTVAIAGVSSLLLLAVTTFLRQQSEGAGGSFDIARSTRSMSDALLLNLNFSEIPKAVNIIMAVPERLPYSYGSTIGNFTIAWIPRSIWPDKPIIDAGVAVGVNVYGTDGSAIPPGAIAEFFWAFGGVGLISGCFLLGVLLSRVSELVRPHTAGAAGALLYATSIFDIGGNAVSGSIGYAITSALLAAGMMTVVLLAAGSVRGAGGHFLPRPSGAAHEVRARPPAIRGGGEGLGRVVKPHSRL